MKKVMIGLTLAAVVAALPLAAVAQEAKGPILHLAFDDGAGAVAKDASGNNRHATVKTDAKGTAAEVADIWVKEGKKGGAIKFDGANVYVMLPKTGLDREDKPFTFEAWINGSGTLLANGDTSGAYALKWLVQVGINSKKFNHCIGQSQTAGIVWSDIEHKSNVTGWTHIAVVNDGEGGLIYYVNGKNVGEVVWEGFKTCEPCDEYRVGAWFHNQKYSGLFKGMMDELKIYDYIRTDAQIAEAAK